MLIGLVSMPYLLNNLGVEKLGILTLIWALIGYFSIFDFGLGRALTQKLSVDFVRSTAEECSRTAKSGLRFLFIAGLGGTLLVLLVLKFLGVSWLNISPGNYGEVYNAILIASIAIPVTTLTSGLKGILEGLEEFRIVNGLKFILGLTNFLSPVLSIFIFGPSLFEIVLLLALSRLLILLMYVWEVKDRVNILNHKNVLKNRSDGRGLLYFGFWMTVSNIISPLMVVADRFVISSILGAGSVAYYSVPSDFLLRILIVPAALTTTLFPAFSKTIEADRARARALYVKALRSIVIVMMPIVIVTTVGAHTGLRMWLGSDFADHAYLITIILSAGVFFNAMAQTPYTLIQANGKARITSLIHCGEFVVYAPLLVLGVKAYGLTGAAIVWSARALIDLILLQRFAKAILNNGETSRALVPNGSI